LRRVHHLAPLALGCLGVHPRAEPPELVKRRVQLEVRVLLVVQRAQRA
jgi:hypothetical protein